MKLADIEKAAQAAHLTVLGGFHPDAEEGLGKTLLLLGPGERFWQHFAQSPEMRDGQDNPMDRWSLRVISRLAEVTDGRALFPFGDAPYHPFFTWATRTGRIFPSPITFLVHAQQGLWVSFRGALTFNTEIDLPEPLPSPCETCTEKPCLTACPVSALTAGGYDVPRCKAYLAEGPSCMQSGCAVRASCPVSQQYDRDPNQSAFHMKAFI